MTKLARIMWDVILYGARGKRGELSDFYRYVQSDALGRVALWSIHFGIHCVFSGNLALLAIYLRRNDYAV